MRIRLNEDYYQWCCEWCDTENRVLWARMHEVVYCGACHHPEQLGGQMHGPLENSISAGLV